MPVMLQAASGRQVLEAKQSQQAPWPRAAGGNLPEDLVALCAQMPDRDPAARHVPSDEVALARLFPVLKRVRTSTFCIYLADTTSSVEWEL